jgi:DNA-directed RNA polymerase sigma subunit (sigma70/sigma32)
VHITQKITKIQDFISTYKSENNDEMPSTNEIKDNVKGISKKVLNDLINGGVINLLSVDRQLSSEGGEAGTFGEIIEDEKIVAPDKNGEFLDNVSNLSFSLNKLKGREKFVLKRRFGLGGKKPETLDEIAESYGVTRERIRQIQLAGMRRLRYSMGRKYGENFFISK